MAETNGVQLLCVVMCLPPCSLTLSKVGVFEYINESSNELKRSSELNDSELDLGRNEAIFSSALSQLASSSSGPTPSAVEVIPSSTGASQRGAEAGAENPGDQDQCMGDEAWAWVCWGF